MAKNSENPNFKMILLVDDDTDDLELVQDALTEGNFKGRVAVALNGLELMTLLNTTPPSALPDLILLDLNMPLKNGFQVLAELRENPQFKSIPVFVLTASSSKADEIRCLELGCSYFLRKPSSLKEYGQLVDFITDFLERDSTRPLA